MRDAALKHLHHVWRAGDVNPKVFRVQLVRDSLNLADEPSGVAAFSKNNHVGRLAIFRN